MSENGNCATTCTRETVSRHAYEDGSGHHEVLKCIRCGAVVHADIPAARGPFVEWTGRMTDAEVAAGAAEIRAGRPWAHVASVPRDATRTDHPDVRAMLAALGKGWSAYMPKQHAIGTFDGGRKGIARVDYLVRYYETAKGVPSEMKPRGPA